MAFPWIMTSVFALIVILFIISIFLIRKQKQEIQDKRPPQGYYLSKGMSFGMILGMLVGFSLDIIFEKNFFGVPAGMCVGMAVGSIIGSHLEKKNKGKLRPLTEQEKKTKKITRTAALIALSILVIIGLIFLVIV